ncbi:MAG: AraC family transcriptional regulator [Verrucomicrobiales bacterium]|nr:AraC family transcriptional regulator [Verrucomicrobiales bacterium]
MIRYSHEREMNCTEAQNRFLEQLGRPWLGGEVFDAIPDCVFFIKDTEGRYVTVNNTLVTRCGADNKSDLIGRRARDVFPPPLGESFTEQDFQVIREGRAIHGQLELHLYPNGSQGWCLTWKEPILDKNGNVAGVSGLSRDLHSAAEYNRDFEPVASVLEHIDGHLAAPLKLSELSEMAKLSGYQLDQRIRALFGLSTAQYITRKRIELACHLLDRGDDTLTGIALDCGYGDQSAFTRQFRQSTGITPGAYRDRGTKTS